MEVIITALQGGLEDFRRQVAAENKGLKAVIHANLESLHTSDWMSSFIGLLWLTIGLLISTLAPEFYRALNWLYG
jgi:hypothetical protein